MPGSFLHVVRRWLLALIFDRSPCKDQGEEEGKEEQKRRKKDEYNEENNDHEKGATTATSFPAAAAID